MMRGTLASVAAATDGRLAGPADTAVTGVAFDSRHVTPGALFVALPGARVDGHDFLAEAAACGAAAALVSRPVETALPCVIVADTLAALGRLAASERAAAPWRLVAVTGSVAKTTTKDMLAALLATTFPIAATRGNRNSEIGFPAEICNLAHSPAWMVAELGMSHAGELDRLGAIAAPDALVYTFIAPVHLEFFPSLDAIAAAKAELIRHLRRDGLLVLNLADARVTAFAGRFAGRIVGYGRAGESDLWIADYASRGLQGSTFTLQGSSYAIVVDLPLAGAHQAANLLAAAATALALGVPAPAIAPAAARLEAPPRRGVIHRLAGGAVLFDDSYNASPLAMTRILELLAETPGRRVAVLGEMLELGATSAALHREVGEQAGAAADVVIAVGGDAAAALAGAAGSSACHVADAAAALDHVRALLRPGDTVLIKGSRGIALDRVVDGLLAGGAA